MVEIEVENMRHSDALSAEYLSSRRIRVSLNVFGALHAGIPGPDLKETVGNSTSVSFELPSIVVASFQEGEMTQADNNPFWRDLLSLNENAVGVNDNRPATIGIRVVDDRVKKEHTVPRNFPDTVVSSRALAARDIARGTITSSEFIDQLRVQDKGFGQAYPSRAYLMEDGKEFYVNVNRPIENDLLSALYVSGRYMLPVEYYLTRGEEIFGSNIGGLHGIEIAQIAMSHLIRTQVDRVQIKSMLKNLRRVVRDTQDGGHVVHTHVGGATHNLNLLSILENVVGENAQIQIHDLRDSRMPDLVPDRLTIFERYAKAKDVLDAVKIIDGQVLVDVESTDRILKQVVSDNFDVLMAFGERELAARDYETAVPKSDNSAEIEYFVIRSLLWMIDPEDIRLIGKVDREYPEKLAAFILRKHPDKKEKVIETMTKYVSRQSNFPLDDSE